MKMFPDGTQTDRSDPRARELDGFVDMGMKRESLRLARRYLKGPALNAELFDSALNAILIQADPLKPWSQLVDAAYARLSKRSQQTVRFLMLAFHNNTRNHESAARFIPSRSNGQSTLPDLVFALDTTLALNKMKEAKKLAKKVTRAARDCEELVMKALLLEGLAEYLVRTGDWNLALDIWKLTQYEPLQTRQSVISIMEVHVACALQAIQQGLQLTEKFKGNIDPEMETTVPGNEKGRFEEARKQL